jgi:membrane protein implicated in regulation of membrane protease activity
MSDSTLWWLLVGSAVGLELVTGTFYLLMVALGLAAGAVAAHLGVGFTAQLVTAAAVGGGAVVVCHRQRRNAPDRLPARANRDVNLDIGATVQIDAWAADGTAQVKYRGALWTAATMPGVAHAGSGPYRIEQVVGSRLLVVPAN